MSIHNKLKYVICLAAICLTFIAPAMGQVAEEASKEVSTNQIRLFELKYVSAAAAGDTVAQLLGNGADITLSAEDSTNRLLARGSEETLQMVDRLLAQLDTPTEPLDQGDQAKPTVKVYHLKYAAAATAYEIASTMLSNHADTRIALDERLNRIIVSAMPTAHDLVSGIIKQIDSATAEPASMVFQTGPKSKSSTPPERLMLSTADTYDVEVELVPELDLAVVRGAKENVSKFADHVDKVMSAVNRPDAELKQAAVESKNYTIRLIWLGQVDKPNSSLTKDLQPIANRAEALGINNLEVVGQLIAVTDAVADISTEFNVEGQPNAFGLDGPCRFAASGTISMASGEPNKLMLSVDLQARLTPAINANETVAALTLRLSPGKPVMIASAPIGGHQSVFVVEVRVND